MTDPLTDPMTDTLTEHMAKAIPITVCINDWPKLWCYCQAIFTLLGCVTSNIQNGVKEIYLNNWKSCFFWRLFWMSGVLAWGWVCGNRFKYGKHRWGDLTCNTLFICVMLNVWEINFQEQNASNQVLKSQKEQNTCPNCFTHIAFEATDSMWDFLTSLHVVFGVTQTLPPSRNSVQLILSHPSCIVFFSVDTVWLFYL